jgi:predicted membrane protein
LNGAERLPVWRLIAGVLVFIGMAAVLIALAPVYFEDFQLQGFVRDLARRPGIATTPDEAIRAQIVGRAHALDLPVEARDVQISHPNGKIRVQMKYEVQIDFPLYQVDLHFHPSAGS